MAISVARDGLVQATCSVQFCGFKTQRCTSMEVASGLLGLHVEFLHAEQTRADKGTHPTQIRIPEPHLFAIFFFFF